MIKHITLIAGSDEYLKSVRITKIASSLKKHGYTLDYVGWGRDRNSPTSFMVDDIPHRLILRGGGKANKKLLFWYGIWIIKLFFFLLRKPPSLLYASNFDVAFPAAIAALFRKHKIIYDIRDSFYMRYTVSSATKRFLMLLDSWTMKKADAILVVDDNRITDFERPFLSKICLIYNCPVDVPPDRIIEEDRPFTVMASGYLKEDRGIILLMDAIRQIPNARLLVAGDTVEKGLKEQLRDHPQVDFRGWLRSEEALQLCHQSDVIAALYDPSTEVYRRAASNKWYDAMMVAKPLLTNKEVMNSKFVQENKIGYLVAYGDLSSLVNTLVHIANQPDEAKKRGQNGRRLYETQYNWNMMEARLLEVVEKQSQTT